MKQEVASKKVYIRTFGCQMNVRDSEVIIGLLKKEGYQVVDSFENADVVIFNTCSVRQHAEDKVWSEIGRIAKLRKKDCFLPAGRQASPSTSRNDTRSGLPIIGVVGCMAQNYKDAVFKRSPQVDFVVGPSDIDKIPVIVEKLLKKRGQSPESGDNPLFLSKIWETDGETRPEDIYHTGFYEDNNHAYVVISEGCSNYCSYCVVPHVRGELHNRNYNDILKEIEQAVDKGVTRVTLLGQNVNAYKSVVKKEIASQKTPAMTNGINFIELLKKVNYINGLKEFSFITSHPRDTTLELFKAMADLEKLNKALHMPVQSGSDRILKLMNRGYSKKFYLDLVDDYRKTVKGGLLTTDIIIGFPTEAENDFQETYDLVKGVCFNAAYIFKYSPRPNTGALKLTDDVVKDEKERRHKLTLDLQKEISREVGKQNPKGECIK